MLIFCYYLHSLQSEATHSMRIQEFPEFSNHPPPVYYAQWPKIRKKCNLWKLQLSEEKKLYSTHISHCTNFSNFRVLWCAPHTYIHDFPDRNIMHILFFWLQDRPRIRKMASFKRQICTSRNHSANHCIQ